MSIGQKIKQLRIANFLTQKELAEKLHVSFQTVSKWENDENEPDINTIKELAKILNCSIIDIIGDEEDEEDEDEEEEEEKPAPAVAPAAPVTQTIIIHQKEPHVCHRCHKDIPEDDLAVWSGTHRERHGRHSRSYPVDLYYHKACLEEERKEREAAAKQLHDERAARRKIKTWGWSIFAGIISLVLFLIASLTVKNARETLGVAGAIFSSIGGSYVIFATVFCILAGSFIGDVFTHVASWTIKFPGLIFSWSFGGFIWLIWMKILFAILGFLFGVMAFLLAAGLSGALAIFCFPFVMIRAIRTDYDDSMFD